MDYGSRAKTDGTVKLGLRGCERFDVFIDARLKNAIDFS